MKALFMLFSTLVLWLGLGMCVSGLVTVLLLSGKPNNFTGPIIDMHPVLSKIFSGKQLVTASNIVADSLRIGLLLMVVPISNFFSFGEDNPRFLKNLLRLFEGLAFGGIVISLSIVMMNGKQFATVTGLESFIIVLWIALSLGCYLVYRFFKLVYEWLLGSNRRVDAAKLSLIWTIIAAIVGWRLSR